MGKELTIKKAATEEHIIAAEIMKAFVLKCNQLEESTIKIFAETALNDGFLASEIQKACFEVARDAVLRKIIYADIYERAKQFKNERVRRAEREQELRKQEAHKAEQERWAKLTPEKQKAELDKFRKEYP